MRALETDNAVVVGIDGSPSSFSAVDLAAEEASLRGVGLRIVHVQSWPSSPQGPGTDTLWNEERHFLDDAVSRAREVAPGVEVTSGIVPGEPVSVLMELSRTARLIALGSRGLGSFRGLLLGSVAVHVAAHAHCPVLVSRGTPNAAGPVVVGVDGSPANAPATAFAFAEAAMREAELVAAHVWSEWTVPPAAPWEKSMAYAKRSGQLDAEERALLTEAVSGWCEKYPDVRVERRTVRGSTREGLIEASENARLLVVGARGRGGFAGLLLGSVSQAVLHHARCPVVVVRQHDGTGR